jgi:hypothetical protein
MFTPLEPKPVANSGHYCCADQHLTNARRGLSLSIKLQIGVLVININDSLPTLR